MSGSALRACRDVQKSPNGGGSFNGRNRFYSYEACTTPSRNQCQHQNNKRNCGDGDTNEGSGGGYPDGSGYPDNNGYPNNGRYPSNGGYPINGGYPNNHPHPAVYPSNVVYPNNNNNRPNYPNNNWPLKQQHGLGTPRDDVKETPINFGN